MPKNRSAFHLEFYSNFFQDFSLLLRRIPRQHISRQYNIHTFIAERNLRQIGRYFFPRRLIIFQIFRPINSESVKFIFRQKFKNVRQQFPTITTQIRQSIFSIRCHFLSDNISKKFGALSIYFNSGLCFIYLRAENRRCASALLYRGGGYFVV